ncbi:DNA glycosylase AlkZ-like family protein [Actinokineospora pegani]|uniref:DNA glycosylase AlkZ-like family protein n=1 Tax=Actinokineospora pegani TaxID=2654637 RepID=UPI0012EA588F|nr:crosslink repair DNA glycosylase YcaQ family protein [Actinokineospora pegani]
MDLVSRSVSQGLAGQRPGSPVDAVRRIVGQPARDPFAAALAIRARTDGLVLGDVDDALTSGALVRTWAMRGALHVVAAADAAWLVALLGPRAAADLRDRRHALGLDDTRVAHGAKVLAESCVVPRTRAELLADLAESGMALDDTRAFAQLVVFTALTGQIVRVADVGGEPTFARAETCVEEEAVLLDRLASRYLAGYGPATWEDFAAWSGLPTGKAKSAFGRQYPPAAPPEPARTVRLLGPSDAYLLGYGSRVFVVPSGFEERVEQEGVVQPLVVVDGGTVGTWGMEGGVVQVAPFAILPRGVGALLRAEVGELGRFLGVELVLQERA